MKSLNGFRQLTLTCFGLIFTTFAIACIYSDLIFTSTSYMEFSEVKFEKRLDDNYERFVASKKQISIPVIKIQKQNTKKKFSKPTLVSESKSDLTNNEEKVEILTARFNTLKIRPVNKELEGATVDPESSEISVKIVNNQITEITNLSIIFDNSVQYVITSSIPVNLLSGQFSIPSPTGSEYKDGGFVNFDNNTYTLNVRFFTGILQDSLIVFKNHETAQEVADNNSDINHNDDNNSNPDAAYEQIVADDEAAAFKEAAQPQPQLAFQTKEDALQHRMSANERGINSNQQQNLEEDENNLAARELEESSDEEKMTEESEQPEMNAVEPERAEGFSFQSNNERI